eukprot:6451972-Heterocapsa_arctica.AAC.1
MMRISGDKGRRIITGIARILWTSDSEHWGEELRMGHGVLLWKGKGDKKNLDSHRLIVLLS